MKYLNYIIIFPLAFSPLSIADRFDKDDSGNIFVESQVILNYKPGFATQRTLSLRPIYKVGCM